MSKIEKVLALVGVVVAGILASILTGQVKDDAPAKKVVENAKKAAEKSKTEASKQRKAAEKTECRHVLEVKTTFYDETREIDGPIRSMDLPDHLLDDWPTIRSDLEPRAEPVHLPGVDETDERLKALGYIE